MSQRTRHEDIRLPDPIVHNCVSVLKAMCNGDNYNLDVAWQNIRQRRNELGLKNVDFWEPVFDDITQRCQLNHVPVDSWRIAMLVSHIKAWDQPDLTKTLYYKECKRNKLHDLNVEEKMNTSFVPMESSNPYIVKLR